MQAGTVSEAVPFQVELDADFSAICSIQAHDAVSVVLAEELVESLHHPQTWFHVRVYLLLPLSLESQSVSA